MMKAELTAEDRPAFKAQVKLSAGIWDYVAHKEKRSVQVPVVLPCIVLVKLP